MNSSKLKWILILLFLSVNLFFLYEYLTYSNVIESYTQNEIENAVQVLEKNNTPVEISAVPESKTTLPVLKLELDDAYREKAAKALMSSSFAQFALPDGTGYSNDKESLTFFEGASFRYSNSGFENYDENILENANGIESPSHEKLIKSLSEKLFSSSITVQNTLSLKLIKSCEKNNLIYLKAYQTVNGTEIDKNFIDFVFQKDTLVFAQGEMFFLTDISEFSADTLDVINVLFKTKKEEDTIIEINNLYFPVVTENSSFYLTPSYRFIHESGKVQVRDATSGVQRY